MSLCRRDEGERGVLRRVSTMISPTAITTACKFALSRMRDSTNDTRKRGTLMCRYADAGCRSIVITGAFSGNGFYIRVRDTDDSFLRFKRERERGEKRRKKKTRVQSDLDARQAYTPFVAFRENRVFALSLLESPLLRLRPSELIIHRPAPRSLRLDR